MQSATGGQKRGDGGPGMRQVEETRIACMGDIGLVKPTATAAWVLSGYVAQYCGKYMQVGELDRIVNYSGSQSDDLECSMGNLANHGLRVLA